MGVQGNLEKERRSYRDARVFVVAALQSGVSSLEGAGTGGADNRVKTAGQNLCWCCLVLAGEIQICHVWWYGAAEVVALHPAHDTQMKVGVIKILAS